MEFISHDPFPPSANRFGEDHYHDLCSSVTGHPSSDHAGPTAEDEANEKIGRFLEGMGQVLLGIPLFLAKSLVVVKNAACSAASSIAEQATTAARCTAYHAHKTGYVLINSEGTVWDGEVWDAKLKTDFVKELLTVSDEHELAKLNAARKLIGADDHNDLTNLAINKIANRLKQPSPNLPEISDGALQKSANTILSTVSRKKILDILSRKVSTPLIQIAEIFLAADDKDAQLTSYELMVVSVLVEGERVAPIISKQKLKASNAEGDLDLSKLDVDEAVKVLMYELGKMPAVSDEAAKEHGDTLASREKLSALLKKMPQTRLVQIALKFLDEASQGDPTKPLNINEWTLFSPLAEAITVEQKSKCKQSQRALEAESIPTQKLVAEYEAVYKKKYEEQCAHLKRKNKAFQLPANAKNLANEAKKKLNGDQELQKKSAEKAQASTALDKKDRANIELQSQLKTAEQIESLIFFAWDKLSHADGITYLDEQTKHEFLPGYSKVKVTSVTVGVDFGLKKLIPGEPEAYAGARIGPTYTDNYFADDENYLGHVTGQWSVLASLLFKAKWDGMYGVSGNASGTYSVHARYAEWGTAHKRNLHQFHDKGRADSNNIEFHGHHYDSQVNKFKDDPGFKPYLSRRARLGMRTDSYLEYYSWDEVTRIDEEKRKFDATEKKQEGDMKAQLSVALTSTVYTDEQRAAMIQTKSQLGTEYTDEQRAAINQDKFHLRELFREITNTEISQLKDQRNRDIEDVERELGAIQGQCIKMVKESYDASQHDPIEATWSELNSEINLLKINKRELKKQKIERLNELGLKLNELDAQLHPDDRLSEKITSLIAELCILLAEKVNEEHAAAQQSTDKVTGIKWIDKLFADLDERKNETMHARQHRLDVAIENKESELWKNELKLDLLFKLMPLNSECAAIKIAQLVKDLGLQNHGLSFKPNPTKDDDAHAGKLIAIYTFKLDYVAKQSQIHQVKLKRNLDVAAVKLDYAEKIAKAHDDLDNTSSASERKVLPHKKVPRSGRGSLVDVSMHYEITGMLPRTEQSSEQSQEESDHDLSRGALKKISKKELKLPKIEELEQERDSKIREIETIAQLDESDIELRINLAALQVQGGNQNQDKETELRKEHAFKKHRIAVQLEIQNLKQKHALDLAATERQWDIKSAHQEYKHAAEIRKAEKELKEVEFEVRLNFANDKAKETINDELTRFRNSWQLHEDKIEDFARRNDPGIAEIGELRKSILKLDVTGLLQNKGNKTLEEIQKELKEQAVLKVDQFNHRQAKDLAEIEHQRDLAFAHLDEKHAAKIRKAEKELKQAELKTELNFAKDDNESSKIRARSKCLKIEFEIDELRRQRDFDIETLSDEELLATFDKKDATQIEEFGPTLWRMKMCEAETKELEEELEEIIISLNPWAQTIEEIKALSNEQFQKSVISKDPAEIEKNKANLSIYKLEVQRLIKLLPLQSKTANEQRDQLIEKLKFQHLFTKEQLNITAYSLDDETKAQKIGAKYDLRIFNVSVARDRNLENINYQRALTKNKKDYQLTVNAFTGVKDKEKGRELYTLLTDQNTLTEAHFETLKEINSRVYSAPKSQNKQNQERIEQLAKEEKDKKADEQAWAKEYASWIPVRNQAPINFTNTDVEHNGAYLADYLTYWGSASVSGDASTGALGPGGAVELSGKYRYTNLTRQKFTFACDMLGNIYKPMEEKKGIARLVNEQLNSEAPKTWMGELGDWWSPPEKPVSIKDIIISGWRENNLFRYAPDAVSKKPVSVTYENGETRPGFSVDTSYFTVEHALRCVNQDMVSIIDLQHKMKSNNESLSKGTEEALATLQKRYGARNMVELVRHMSFFITHLRVLSTHGGDYSVANPTQIAIDKKPTKEVIELQGRIKEAEARLFDRVQVEKEEYWRECGVEESQIVLVTLEQGVLKGKVGPKLGPIGSYVTRSFKLEHFERHHVVHSRDANYVDITSAWGYLSGLANAIGVLPEGLQDTIMDGWNTVLPESVSNQDGNMPIVSNNYNEESSKTARYHWLRRFEPLYKEFGYTMEWTPTYTRKMITTENKIGGEVSVPLDKIMAIPVHPVFGANTTLTETKTTNEQWRGLSHNHFLMHYTHARDIGDLDRETGGFLKQDCFWVNSRKNQRAGFMELFFSHGHQQWQSTHKKTPTLNELHVREVEFRRITSLDPGVFRDFQRAKAHFLRLTKYYDVLQNSPKRIAEMNREIAWLKKKNAEVSTEFQSGKITSAEGDKKIKKREQRIENLEKKIRRVNTTLTEARMFFKEKNKDAKCSLTDFAHTHCQESLEAMYHAYSPHDYSLLVNSRLYGASTMVVNGEQKATYNKTALKKAAKRVEAGTEQRKTYDREEFNYYDDADTFHRNMSETAYLSYGFK